MRKRLLLLALVFSCGPAGEGFDTEGLYGLKVTLDSKVIKSYAVRIGQTGYPEIPPDVISGEVVLEYYGSGQNPLSGVIRKGQLCVRGVCASVPVSGTVSVGNSLRFSAEVSFYKFYDPWIFLNPFEDRTQSETFATVRLFGGEQAGSLTANYEGRALRLLLTPYVVEGSVNIRTQNGTFEGTYVYPSYTSQEGTASFEVPLGGGFGNSLVPGSVRIEAGSVICVDDGFGTIVDASGGNACSGNVKYDAGRIDVYVDGIGEPTDLIVSYRFQGYLVCSDDGNGNLVADCRGSVNYLTGELLLDLAYGITSPVSLDVTYAYRTGSSDGKTFTFVLPEDNVNPEYPYLKTVHGEFIEVLKSGAVACDNHLNGNECSVLRDGKVVTITFYEVQRSVIDVRYSVRTFYDFNPSVYTGNRPVEGSSLVDGFLAIEVELEDGTVLRTKTGITFDVSGLEPVQGVIQ